MLTVTQRRMMLGGLGGMVIFLTGLLFWLR
jgi:hypothetical protein